MDTKQTFKLVGYYRLLSWVSFGVGMAFVGLGVYLGLGETISIVLANFPAEFDRAVAAANPILAVALSAVGLVIWQVGKSFALTKTMERAIATEDSGGSDEQLKSEVLDVVNDQLSSVEKDLRAEIRKIERDAADDDGLSAGTSVSTSAGSTSTSSGGSSGGSQSGRSGRSGSQRSSRSSRSSRSESGGRTGGSGSSQSDGGTENGDDGRSERATDAADGDGSEKRSRRRKRDDDEDDDPLS